MSSVCLISLEYDEGRYGLILHHYNSHQLEKAELRSEKAKNKYSVDIELIRPITQIDKNGDLHNIDHFLFGDVSRVEESENFFIVCTGNEKEYLDICNIQRISIRVVGEQK